MNKYWKPWENIVDLLNPPSGVVTLIGADTIKKATGFEPRLMTKFDREEDLPPALAKRGLFILPVTNGVYGLIPGKGYHPLNQISGSVLEFSSILPFPLYSSGYGRSEMSRLDYAFNTGLISDFTGTNHLYQSIRGRKFSPSFNFRVGGHPIPEVASVQVEVDSGFEGKDEIIIFEAKIGFQDSFHIRQLYYPYMFWKTAVPNKKIRPIFFIYEPADDTYRFYEFAFPNPEEYNSIEQVKQQKYRIISKEHKVLLFSNPAQEATANPKEKNLIIPQANDINKIIALPFLVASGIDTKGETAEALEMTPRQSSYYRQACQLLGLISHRKGKYCLTEVGSRYVNLPIEKRNRLLCRQMLDIPIIREIMSALIREKRLTMGQLAEIIRINSSLSGKTLMRRAGTVKSWFCWLYQAAGIVKAGRDALFI